MNLNHRRILLTFSLFPLGLLLIAFGMGCHPTRSISRIDSSNNNLYYVAYIHASSIEPFDILINDVRVLQNKEETNGKKTWMNVYEGKNANPWVHDEAPQEGALIDVLIALDDTYLKNKKNKTLTITQSSAHQSSTKLIEGPFQFELRLYDHPDWRSHPESDYRLITNYVYKANSAKHSNTHSQTFP